MGQRDSVAALLEEAGRPRRLTGIELVVWGYGAWAVSFWGTSTIGLGWAFALPLCLLLIAEAVARHRVDVMSSFRSLPGRGSVVAWVVAMLLAASIVVAPGSLRIAAIAGAAVVCALALRRADRAGALLNSHATTFVVAPVLVGLLLAWLQTRSWVGFIVGIGITAAAAAWLTHRHGPSGDESLPRGPGCASRTEWPVYLSGLVLGAWTLFEPQPNPDDIYYLNKAAHYADNATWFSRRDYLFGMPELDHLPMADFLSGIEPLAGLLSALSGVGHETVMAFVLAPVAALLVPFAVRYAAAACRCPAPDAAGVIAAALVFMHPLYAESQMLTDKINQGKGMAVLVAAPVLFGACVRYWRDHDVDRRLVLTMVAAAATVTGLTPSAATAAAGISGAAFLVGNRDWRRPTRRSLLGLLPVIVGAGVGIAGYALEQTDPVIVEGWEEDRRFAVASNAWVRSTADGTSNILEPSWELISVLVVLCTVAAMFIVRDRVARSMISVVAVVLLVMLLSPDFFEHVLTGRLGLNLLVWRFVWMLPLGVIIGTVTAQWLSSRHLLAVLAGSALVVAMFWNTAPLEFESPKPVLDLDPQSLETARLILEHTPDGGRFLAPAGPEGVATALSADVHPTYGRPLLLRFQWLRGAPESLLFGRRTDLRWWLTGDKRARGTFISNLDEVQVSAVCVPFGEQAVALITELGAHGFSYVERTPDCELHVR